MYKQVWHCLYTGLGLFGEMMIIQNITRYCDDYYECVASNGVRPAVRRQMRVAVECKLITLITVKITLSLEMQ